VGKKSVGRNTRLDALRREQKRRERRRALIIYGSAGLVVLALLGGIVAFIVIDSVHKDAEHKVGYVAAASEAASKAGCTGVVNDPMKGSTHVGPTDTVNYDASPPSSGNHDFDPLPGVFRFYKPTANVRPERAVHNLEHGFVVGWYDRDLPADQVDMLQAVAESAGDRFIAVPWTRTIFPDAKHFVLTAWDRTQRCATVSGAAVTDFVTKYVNPDLSGATWESPTAPESGAAGGNQNITPDGPLPAGSASSVTPGPGTMSPPSGSPPSGSPLPGSSQPGSPSTASAPAP
jgi:hypothetical protein